MSHFDSIWKSQGHYTLGTTTLPTLKFNKSLLQTEA
jgi:hypothetical protein